MAFEKYEPEELKDILASFHHLKADEVSSINSEIDNNFAQHGIIVQTSSGMHTFKGDKMLQFQVNMNLVAAEEHEKENALGFLKNAERVIHKSHARTEQKNPEAAAEWNEVYLPLMENTGDLFVRHGDDDLAFQCYLWAYNHTTEQHPLHKSLQQKLEQVF